MLLLRNAVASFGIPSSRLAAASPIAGMAPGLPRKPQIRLLTSSRASWGQQQLARTPQRGFLQKTCCVFDPISLTYAVAVASREWPTALLAVMVHRRRLQARVTRYHWLSGSAMPGPPRVSSSCVEWNKEGLRCVLVGIVGPQAEWQRMGWCSCPVPCSWWPPAATP